MSRGKDSGRRKCKLEESKIRDLPTALLAHTIPSYFKDLLAWFCWGGGEKGCHIYLHRLVIHVAKVHGQGEAEREQPCCNVEDVNENPVVSK